MTGVQIAAVGDVNEDILLMVARHVSEMFGLETEVHAPPCGSGVAEKGGCLLILPAPDYALDAERNQYSSTVILRQLAQTGLPEVTRFLALTDVDLFIPMVTFVYGQAQLSSPSEPDFDRRKFAVVSLARLRQQFYGLSPDKDLTVRRLRKEVSHELGHTFGLVHCGDKSCLMSLSTEVFQIDMKSDDFCRSCWVVLEENLKAIRKKGKHKNFAGLYK